MNDITNLKVHFKTRSGNVNISGLQIFGKHYDIHNNVANIMSKKSSFDSRNGISKQANLYVI